MTNAGTDLNSIYKDLSKGQRHDDLQLFINCFPVPAEGVISLEEWLAPLSQWIASENKASHFLLMPYSEGVKAITAVIDKAPALVGKIRIRTTTALARELLPILERRATYRVIPDNY